MLFMSNSAPANLIALTLCLDARIRPCCGRMLNALHLNRDSFDFCVLLQSVLTHFPPDTGLLEAAKRRCRIENVEAVHPNGARTHAVRDRKGLADVSSPDGCRQPVCRVVRACNDFV